MLGRAAALALILTVLGCADHEQATFGGDHPGPSTTIRIAPLSLPGLEDVVWDLALANGVGEAVW